MKATIQHISKYTNMCQNTELFVKTQVYLANANSLANTNLFSQNYDEREVISAYFRKGHKYSRIVEPLRKGAQCNDVSSNSEKPSQSIQSKTP